MMQRHADVALVLGAGRRKRKGGIADGYDRLRTAGGRSQLVVVPAKQDSLEQDRHDAEERDPASRPYLS